MDELGILEVGFEGNLDGLTSSFTSAKSQADAFGGAISESNDLMLSSYDELASGIGSAMSSIAEDTVSASSSLGEMASQGSAAGTDLIGILGELLDSVNRLRETMIDMSNGVTDSLLHIENSTNDVRYAIEGMSSSVTGSIEDLDIQFTTLGQSAQVAGEEIASAGDHASGSGGWLNFFNQIGIGIFNIQNMINIAGQLTGALLGPAISAEEVTSSLEIFTGSAAKAKQELQDLSNFAAHTPFETAAIDDAALKMQSVGISAHDVIPYIQALGDALDATGRISSADLNQIVDSFSKIKTEGHLTTDVMNSFALAGIDAWSVLEQQTGKTHAQLADLISKGLYPANQAMRDLTEGIEKSPIYKGQMANDANLITGAISTLKSNWDQVLAAFGSPIIKAVEPVLNNLSSAISSPAFKDFAGGVGQGIVDVFQGIGDAGTYVGNVLHSLNLTGLQQAWHDLSTAVAPLITDFQNLGIALNPIEGDFDPLAEAIASLGKAGLSGLTTLIEGLAQGLGTLTSNKEVSGFLSDLGSGFQQVQSIVGGELSKDFEQFTHIAQDLSKWFESDLAPAIHQAEPGFSKLGSVLATDVAPALAQVWAVGNQLAREALPPLTKAFETVEPIVVRVGGFLADKLGDAIHTITPDIVSATKAIGQFGSDIATRAEPIIKEIASDLKTFLDWIGPYWPSIWGAISADFTATWDILKGVVQIGWALISGIIKIGLDLFSGDWKRAWEDVKGTFSGIWDGIKSIASGVWAGIGGGIKAGINDVIDLINNFIHGIDSISLDLGPVHLHPSIPTIPHLAAGGIVPPGGVAIAGDPGPNEELVFGGTSGATVLSNAQSSALLSRTMASNGASREVHVHVYLDSREMAHVLVDPVGQKIVKKLLSQGPVRSVA